MEQRIQKCIMFAILELAVRNIIIVVLLSSPFCFSFKVMEIYIYIATSCCYCYYCYCHSFQLFSHVYITPLICFSIIIVVAVIIIVFFFVTKALFLLFFLVFYPLFWYFLFSFYLFCFIFTICLMWRHLNMHPLKCKSSICMFIQKNMQNIYRDKREVQPFIKLRLSLTILMFVYKK